MEGRPTTELDLPLGREDAMDCVDLRSDTVSWPTNEMRRAMASAAVGDDVYGEDPTVLQLEADAARVMGKEASLFVASGTQGNLIAIMVHCRRGDEAIMGDLSHTFYYEDLQDIEAAFRPDYDVHCPTTRLICLENTHNKIGGRALSPEYTDSVGKLAHSRGLKLHIDGARIFNAAAALEVPVSRLVEAADSVTFCLSKGLCAPCGGILVGSAAFIREARRVRKMLGGGMRQAGVLAAAGLIALHKMSRRLREDHEQAIKLAKGLAAVGPAVKVRSCDTNFVFIDLDLSATKFGTVDEFIKVLRDQHAIRLGGSYPTPTGFIRLVTHYYINDAAVARVVDVFKQLLAP